jgi:hypothetical protein
VALGPNGTATVTLTFTNTGNITWPAAGPVRLGTEDPENHNDPLAGPHWLTPYRVGPLSAAAPGKNADITFNLVGAHQPAGNQTQAFRVLWEGAEWFGPTVTFTVHVL